MALFSFVMLYYDVCSDKSTFLFCIIIVFLKDQTYKKYDWWEFSRYYYCLQTTIPTITEPATLLQIPPFSPSLPTLPYISNHLLFSKSIDLIVWHKRHGRWPARTPLVAIARKPHAFKQDQLVIAIVPDNLTHMLIFTIFHPAVILIYCVVDIFW